MLGTRPYGHQRTRRSGHRVICFTYIAIVTDEALYDARKEVAYGLPNGSEA